MEELEPLFDASSEKFPTCNIDNADLRPFAAHGGKLMIDHGWDDPLIPTMGTIDYYQRMVQIVGGREKADAFCWLLLLELLESRNKNDVYSELYKKIQDIAVYIQAHCLEISSISELARTHGFSERSFLRHWMTFFSETPLQMIIRYKLEYACSRLRYTDMTISSIAEALQFSAIYFDRLFYKKIGMTPRQYRNACNVCAQRAPW